MDLKALIESAEKQYKQVLEEYFISVYKERKLPSHGISHHRRVWKYARELLLLAGAYNKIEDPTLPSGLLIASYLHDSGMSDDPGPKHGLLSLRLTQSFLKKQKLHEDEFPGMSDAISEHDDKEYSNAEASIDIKTILASADDLDAFGFTGIYRYLEIYLTRNMDFPILGIKIRENASARYEHFRRVFSFNDMIVLKYRNKYEILDHFTREYDKQLPMYDFGKEKPQGYCGIAEIMKNSVDTRSDFMNFIFHPGHFASDKVIRWFYEGIRSELCKNDWNF
jgi:hypothetical protein